MTTQLLVQDTQGAYRLASDIEILDIASAVMFSRICNGEKLSSPKETIGFLKTRLSHLEHEVFGVIWLDNRHRVIEFEQMFRGTIDGSVVHPREVVKSALDRNAAACILAHNHPSGACDPSQADIKITVRLKEALALVDVRVLDHVIVGDGHCSMAERGLI